MMMVGKIKVILKKIVCCCVVVAFATAPIFAPMLVEKIINADVKTESLVAYSKPFIERLHGVVAAIPSERIVYEEHYHLLSSGTASPSSGLPITKMQFMVGTYESDYQNLLMKARELSREL